MDFRLETNKDGVNDNIDYTDKSSLHCSISPRMVS